MLSTMRQSWLLYTLVALMTLSSALSLEDALHIDGIEAYLHHGVKRQLATGNSATTDAAPTSADDPTSAAPTSNPPEETSAAPAPSPTDDDTTTEDNPPQSTPAPSSQAPTSGGNQDTSPPASTPAESTAERPTSTRVTTPIVRTTPLVATSVQEFVTVYTTQSDGQNIAVTSTSRSSYAVTTGQTIQTQLPNTQPGSGGDSGGLTDDNKKIIGGVVGGVGGAILLGGIAIVCWRIWGKKKRVVDDDADLIAGTGSALGDKPQNGSSPFQSNLEQYHNPGGRPNAAANF